MPPIVYFVIGESQGESFKNLPDFPFAVSKSSPISFMSISYAIFVPINPTGVFNHNIKSTKKKTSNEQSLLEGFFGNVEVVHDIFIASADLSVLCHEKE